MKTFKDINLRAIGNTVQLVGGVWAGDGEAHIFYFPEYGKEFEAQVIEMTEEDWKQLLHQSDQVETEVLAKAEDGTYIKAVVRKCQRTIDQHVSWNVFRRDGYKCRYCANDKVPLTVDHLVLWEAAGPTIEENLVSACKKCNKVRGDTEYAEWVRNHRYYQDVSRKLTEETRQKNLALIATLDKIPRVAHVRSRK